MSLEDRGANIGVMLIAERLSNHLEADVTDRHIANLVYGKAGDFMDSALYALSITEGTIPYRIAVFKDNERLRKGQFSLDVVQEVAERMEVRTPGRDNFDNQALGIFLSILRDINLNLILDGKQSVSPSDLQLFQTFAKSLFRVAKNRDLNSPLE